MAKGGGIKSSKGAGKGDGAAKAAPVAAVAQTAESTLAGLQQIYNSASELDQGGLFGMERARELSPLKGEAFDKEMHSLFMQDKIIMHSHDLPSYADPEKRKNFVKDAYGNEYHLWTMRR